MREFALRPMGDFLLVLDHTVYTLDCQVFYVLHIAPSSLELFIQISLALGVVLAPLPACGFSSFNITGFTLHAGYYLSLCLSAFF